MTSERASNTDTRRRRGRKPYPTLRFERTLELPKAIVEHGVEGRIRRLTLFQQMERSPESSSSRLLISTSSRYGLTRGGHTADYLELTDTGEATVRGSRDNITTLDMAFNQAISGTSAFDSVYERLKNERIPTAQVLQDLLAQEGIDLSDCEEAANIFVENIRYLGLIQEQTGNEYIIPLEQRIEELSVETHDVSDASDTDSAIESAEAPSAEHEAVLTQGSQNTMNMPTLHLDIQIHIDPSADADQIDQIFASMARHLYGREG